MKKNPQTEENLLKILEREKRPLRLKDIEKVLCTSESDRKILKILVRDLIKKGFLYKMKNRMIGIKKAIDLEVGTLWCTKNGDGFVIPDREGKEDIFIPRRFTGDALHGDRVSVRVDAKGRRKRNGKIIRVLERKTHTVTGFIKTQKNKLYLYPDDERITHKFIIEDSKNALHFSDDTLAACKITRFPEGNKPPACKIISTFETLSDVKDISLYTIYKYSLPRKFKHTTVQYLRNKKLNIDSEGRKDIREKSFITIDGEEAKDFDDAVFVEKTRDGFTLYVSIADVSHYVPHHSPPDIEAYERGTSVYFPGTVIPMLHRVLSNGICSLNPHRDRCCITVELKYNRNGEPIDAAFYPSVIRSAMRLTYTKAEEMIAKSRPYMYRPSDYLYRLLAHMAELTWLLKDKREKRGTIDFDLPEPEVVLDIEGGLKGIIKSPRLFSHRIIEEFMIAANEAVAQFLTDHNRPFIYRIHEPPDRERVLNIERILHNLDLSLDRKTGKQLYLQSVISGVKGTVYEYFINRIVLRSMKQARYSVYNKGHFGLGSEVYTHFTSPIRRYPDLINHRILKGLLNGDSEFYREEELESMAIHLSERERIAMEAEREVEDRIRVLHMRDKIGEIFEGIISHVTSYGFYVELIDVFVEGFVHLSDMADDYYVFEEERFRLRGRRTKKTLRIGDRVKVRVVRADVERNQLQFVPLLR